MILALAVVVKNTKPATARKNKKPKKQTLYDN
jgi:hypothetical protein